VINAFLRTKALERLPVPHEAELTMAVSAVIFHNFLSGWHLNRPVDDYDRTVHRSMMLTVRYALKELGPFAISTSGATIIGRPGPRFSI